MPEGGDGVIGNDNHSNPAGRRGLPKAVRESSRVHDAVHAAASGNRATLLLPAKQKGNRPTPNADGGNHPPTLEGKITVGLYAINPSTQRCKWVAIDADYKNSMEDLLKLQYHLTQDRVEPALEMSKRGGHLWIFLDTPLLAKDCRIYIHDLALRLGVPVKGAGLADGIEVFPKHDAIGTGEFGNAIRGPLGIHRGANRRFWFYGADYTLDDQIAYLNRLRKVTEEELRRFIAGKERREPVRSPRPGRVTSTRRRTETDEQNSAFWST